MNLTVGELNVLLTLNGNQRLAHLEEEIFSNELLYALYLRQLCVQLEWHNVTLHFNDITVIHWEIYAYAVNVIGGRWIAAEQVIISETHTYWSNNYTMVFLRE